MSKWACNEDGLVWDTDPALGKDNVICAVDARSAKMIVFHHNKRVWMGFSEHRIPINCPRCGRTEGKVRHSSPSPGPYQQEDGKTVCKGYGGSLTELVCEKCQCAVARAPGAEWFGPPEEEPKLPSLAEGLDASEAIEKAERNA